MSTDHPPRYETRERNGRWGVWDRSLALWTENELDMDEMDETDAGILAADLNTRNPEGD